LLPDLTARFWLIPEKFLRTDSVLSEIFII
jgi:hypothetical protein